MKIGIMGAMREEIDAILPYINNHTRVMHGEREYHLGKIGSSEVILVFSGWGKVASAITADSLINVFKIDQLIFTGVAGAVSSDLNIGDIVISSKLYQHDMDARPLMLLHEIPLTGITFFNADVALIRKAEAASVKLLQRLSEEADPEALAAFDIKQPKCITGVIATGDQFIRDHAQVLALLREKPETAAVEMEGAAVAQVCAAYKKPFVVIRAISDNADHKSSIDFPRFIQKIAKHYAEHIVTDMILSCDVAEPAVCA